MVHIKLRRQLDEDIATRHPWKQLLGTASSQTVNAVLRALEAYLQIGYVSAERSAMPGGTGGTRQDDLQAEARGAVELFNAAEQDLEKGLRFIREVEKGSHMKADAVLRFRPEAVEALCELCCGRIEEVRAEAGRDGGEDEETEEEGREDGKDGREDEEDEADTDHEGAADVIRERRRASHIEVVKGLIGTVYRHIDPQFKTRLQLLVHQHKTKGRSR